MGIYIGNLPFDVTEEEISTLFLKYGCIITIQIPPDQDTDCPQGFAFVEMNAATDELRAIKALDGSKWLGCTLTVKQARPLIEGQARSINPNPSHRVSWSKPQNSSRRRYW